MRLVVMILAAMVLYGCSGGPEIRTVRLSAEKDLNQNSADKSTPVNFRLYQLTDPAEFEAAVFDSLWDREKDTLAGTLVGEPKELVITSADGALEFPWEIAENVKFIGVAGLFNQLDESRCKQVVSTEKIDELLLVFRGYGIDPVDPAEVDN